MRRLTPFVLAALLTLTACAGDPAVQDAWEKAHRVAEMLKGVDAWVSEEVGYRLAQEEKVTVFQVSGDGPREPGRALVRVRGKEPPPVKPVPMVSVKLAEVYLCFEIEVTYRQKEDRSPAGRRGRSVRLSEVDCPEGWPLLSFRRPAELPSHTRSWLAERLPRTLDLEAAWRVVRDLDLYARRAWCAGTSP